MAPKELCTISSNSNRPRRVTNCITSIEDENNKLRKKAITDLYLAVRKSINNIPIGMNSTTFQNTCAISFTSPLNIALYDQKGIKLY